MTSLPPTVLDTDKVRRDFPILTRRVHDKPLIYFDNANTAHKPQVVIDAVDHFFAHSNANVARAVHQLGDEATMAYESARDKLAALIGANHREEIVLLSGATQATNLVAYSYLLPRLTASDSVLTTYMEHHANIVPWQLVCERRGAKVKAAPINDKGELLVDEYVKMLTPDVKLACVTHVSNVLGTINPIREIAQACHKRGIPLLVDGSQAVPHLPVNVESLGCDFYVATGHKMCAPTGTGFLWAKREHLDAMPPFFGGGEMIEAVTFEHTTYAAVPHKFEAGTPNIAGFVGLAAAVDYLNSLGMAQIAATEQKLGYYMQERLHEVPGLRMFGESADKAPVFSFLIDGVHAHDLATMLDLQGVAVRSGHHCAHPLMQFYDVPATVRASLAFYNTRDEIDAFIDALHYVRRLLK